MHIQAMEDAILARLRDQMPTLEIDGYPLDPEQYQLRHPVGAILVAYRASRYSAPEATDVIVQGRVMEFGITCVAKSLRRVRNQDGLYDLLERVRDALTGYSVDGANKFYPDRDGFASQRNGVWQYEALFRVPTMAVETVPEPSGPLLTTAHFNTGGSFP